MNEIKNEIMEKKILEKMKQRIMRKIAAIEGDINEYKEKFNDDYEKFLNWYAEDLYKCKHRLGHYNSLLTAVEMDDLSFLKETLRHTAEHFSDDILCGSLRRNSSNSFANLAHVLELEVKQEMIKACTVMQAYISDMEKEQKPNK